MVKLEYMLKNILLVIIVVILDQLSKLWVLHKLLPYETLELFDAKFFGLNFFLTYNTGVAFGLFHNASGWQNSMFLLMTVAAVCIMLYLVISNKVSDYLEKLALLLILGGAIGNLIDRIIHKHVIDFIDVYALVQNQHFHWYTFNIADSLICIGVGLLLFKNIFKEHNVLTRI